MKYKAIDEEEYLREETFYFGSDLDLGNIFHSFIYPHSEDEPLKSLFTHTYMKDGIIEFKTQEECEIVNTLSSYTFKGYKSPSEVGALWSWFCVNNSYVLALTACFTS